jgi:hypothetical protein
MIIIALVILFIITAVIIYFQIPFSRTSYEFKKKVDSIINTSHVSQEVFSDDDINHLPKPVQKYFKYCGYIGKTKMSYMKADFHNVDFYMTNKGQKSKLKIDYTQYNFVDKPNRFAYIDSTFHGIPFEGFDAYLNGIGSMKGVLAKSFTLFNQRGESMNKACLVTFLSECLIVPNVALQDYITWESIDDTHAKATISYYGIQASGIFTFDENGLMTSFRTSDRVAAEMDGTEKKADWSAICSNYKEVDGLRLPTVLQAIWHYPEGDFLYFNGYNATFYYQ